jgi:hypothetical protein
VIIVKIQQHPEEVVSAVRSRMFPKLPSYRFFL